MTVAVNLQIGREVETKMQVRRQISELPVADRSLTRLIKVSEAVEPVPAQRPAELNVPKMAVRPSSMTVHPETPRRKPPEFTDRMSVPPPSVVAAPPNIEFSPLERIRRDEEAPQPGPVRLDALAMRPEETPRFQTAPRPVRVSPAPARPTGSAPAETVAKVPPKSPAAPSPAGEPVPQAQKPPLDIPPLAAGPKLKLPAVPAPGTIEERRPVPSGAAPPHTLERREVNVVRERRPGDGYLAGSTAPAKREAGSLAGEMVADVRRPGADEAPPEDVDPMAMVVPLPDLLGPGRLTAPESLFQRSFEQRQKLIDKMGGSEESEAAVARALVYLARNQEDDGRWTFIKDKAGTGKKDKRRKSRRNEVDLAVTGLSALCFLAANHTPTKAGPYQETVRKALDYLVNVQKPDGDLRGGGGRMYGQAMATLALAEAGVMTGENTYAQAAIRGAQFIIKAQNPKTGGWRYEPGHTGDTSVFGWEVMALHAAERLGMRIPDETRVGGFRWLNKVGSGRHGMLAGYTGRGPSAAMTAEAVFARMLLGQQLTQAQQEEAGEYLARTPPGKKGKPNYYYWYYASLTLMQMQNATWTKWNAKLRDHLIRLQQARGEAAGSWDTNSQWGSRGGRIYTTALATLTLEVYYRYLPRYGKARTDDDSKE